MSNRTGYMVFRVKPEAKMQFEALAKDAGLTNSEAMREALSMWVKARRKK